MSFIPISVLVISSPKDRVSINADHSRNHQRLAFYSSSACSPPVRLSPGFIFTIAGQRDGLSNLFKTIDVRAIHDTENDGIWFTGLDPIADR